MTELEFMREEPVLHLNGLFWSYHLKSVYPRSFTPGLLNRLRTAGHRSRLYPSTLLARTN